MTMRTLHLCLVSLVASPNKREGPFGAPVLEDCARWLAGRTVGHHDGGDHLGFVLEPMEAAAGEWSGQLGFQRAKGWSAGHDP